MEYIFYFALTIVMGIFCIILGIAIGCCVTKKEKTDDFFIKRDNFRQRIKELKKQLEKSEDLNKSLHKDNVILRQELEDSAEENYELRFRLRRLDTAKERGNGE